ncbi:uncharacterized protein [Arachis hypogaea]|uniref:uncharacterized protein n=1 Tax=Arachis hypogaea TaxID=3818 RepID=UPI000DED2343|nr:uncharacterized protein LOC112803952 [Arachis hypogaea]QHO43568.1 uncharacterized protein DS421_5g163850 [Arachis hypogaea]
MPKNFNLPTTLKPYEGTGDPNIHVTKFHSMMFLNSAFDPILCRYFPTFLDGATLLWFSSLPAGSISIFQELADLFTNNFTASKFYVHDSDYLSTIKQDQHESLLDYMMMFNKIAMEIPNLNPDIHLYVLKSGLHPSKFHKTITVAKPKTLAEFREKAIGQMKIEELRQVCWINKPTQSKEDDQKDLCESIN